ncbi:hypothetical protein J4Q44_G00385350 [Coregonus suidteri]|uniref:Uncharacterized protein n=1 Tax=Coregonus suidteri TaxID=861788 RepID=A0AAN8QIZ3_9TELE
MVIPASNQAPFAGLPEVTDGDRISGKRTVIGAVMGSLCFIAVCCGAVAQWWCKQRNTMRRSNLTDHNNLQSIQNVTLPQLLSQAYDATSTRCCREEPFRVLRELSDYYTTLSLTHLCGSETISIHRHCGY